MMNCASVSAVAQFIEASINQPMKGVSTSWAKRISRRLGEADSLLPILLGSLSYSNLNAVELTNRFIRGMKLFQFYFVLTLKFSSRTNLFNRLEIYFL
jgi:hypothetical protein